MGLIITISQPCCERKYARECTQNKPPVFLCILYLILTLSGATTVPHVTNTLLDPENSSVYQLNIYKLLLKPVEIFWTSSTVSPLADDGCSYTVSRVELTTDSVCVCKRERGRHGDRGQDMRPVQPQWTSGASELVFLDSSEKLVTP